MSLSPATIEAARDFVRNQHPFPARFKGFSAGGWEGFKVMGEVLENGIDRRLVVLTPFAWGEVQFKRAQFRYRLAGATPLQCVPMAIAYEPQADLDFDPEEDFKLLLLFNEMRIV